VQVPKTTNKAQLIKDHFNSRSPQQPHNLTEWYKEGFVFVRVLDDFIQIKTIELAYDNPINISLSEESLLNYLKWFKKLN
jgi:hypothetical protein